MLSSKNFSFGFTKDISKFIVLEKNIRKVKSKLCNVYRDYLNPWGANTNFKITKAWKFWYVKKSYSTNNISDAVHTRGENPWGRLRDMQTHKTTLALAYMLHCLSTTWSQSQKIERSPRWKWVLIWCVAVKHWRLSLIRVYLHWLLD